MSNDFSFFSNFLFLYFYLNYVLWISLFYLLFQKQLTFHYHHHLQILFLYHCHYHHRLHHIINFFSILELIHQCYLLLISFIQLFPSSLNIFLVHVLSSLILFNIYILPFIFPILLYLMSLSFSFSYFHLEKVLHSLLLKRFSNANILARILMILLFHLHLHHHCLNRQNQILLFQILHFKVYFFSFNFYFL